MAKTTAYGGNILALVFQNVALANIGNAGGLQPSSVAGSLYISLHTADPTVTGNQTSNEITYTSYARVAIARSTGGFTLTSNSISPAATVSFPAGTGGSGTASFWGIGTAASGTGNLLYSGAISPTIVTGSGITPQLTTASAVTES